MPLTILSDENVKDVLGNLTGEDLEVFQEILRIALHKYSTGTQDESACALNQPERTVLVSPAGVTSLFMPSISACSGLGVKVVSLSPSRPETAKSSTTPKGAITLMTSEGLPYAFVNAAELTAFRTALASSLLVRRRQSPKALLVFGTGKQAYWHLRLALLIHGSSLKNIYIIARDLSPKSTSLMKALHDVPYEIKEREGWLNLKIGMLSEAYGEYPRLIKEQIRAADIIFCTTPSTTPLFEHTLLTNKEGRRKGRLIIAIGSYKPNMIEIPVEVIHQAVKEDHKHHHHKHAQEGGVVVVDTLSGGLKEAGELIQSGISPYQLVELGELVMLETQRLATENQVCERLAALDATLEDDEASPRPSMSTNNSSMSSPSMGSPSLTSISTMSTNDSRKSTESSNEKSSEKSKKKKKKGKNTTCANDDALCRWLRDGNVVYKSVGLGLMDLVVGRCIVELARERGIGVSVDSF